jgi:hypothetical protein
MDIKINWENIPEEYKWFAIDRNNNFGYLYKTKPAPHENINIWVEKYFDKVVSVEYTGEYSNWKDTLQQRPTVNTTIPTEMSSNTFDISIQRVGELSDIQITGKLSKQQIAKIMEIIYES